MNQITYRLDDSFESIWSIFFNVMFDCFSSIKAHHLHHLPLLLRISRAHMVTYLYICPHIILIDICSSVKDWQNQPDTAYQLHVWPKRKPAYISIDKLICHQYLLFIQYLLTIAGLYRTKVRIVSSKSKEPNMLAIVDHPVEKDSQLHALMHICRFYFEIKLRIWLVNSQSFFHV